MRTRSFVSAIPFAGLVAMLALQGCSSDAGRTSTFDTNGLADDAPAPAPAPATPDTGTGTISASPGPVAETCALCNATAACTVTDGKAACACPTGYAGDGFVKGTGCTDENECAGTNDCVAAASGGACANTGGSYTCSCAAGYGGDGTVAGTACTDIDECLAGTSGCVAQAGGGSCANTAGGFTCACAPGYAGDGTTAGTGCTDIDECAAGTAACTPTASGGTCTNTAGSYSCGCAADYGGDGTTAGTGCRLLATPEVLWYQFDQTGTAVANHASAAPAGAESGTLSGAVSQGGTGQCGGALVGASNGKVDSGWKLATTGSWSISFYSAAVPSTTNATYIFGETSTGFRCFTGGVAGAGNWILRGNGVSDTVVQGGASTGPAVTTFVYDAGKSEIRAYLDGVLVNTVAQTLTLTGTASFTVGAYASSTPLMTGAKLDDFRFYSHALSVAELTVVAAPFCAN